MENEKRLIDANALKEAMWNADCDVYEFCNGRVTNMGFSRLELDDVIDDCPTVDAVEVVHGEWLRNEDDECYWYTCSECAEYPMRDRWGYEKLTNYCPNCGAKMDGVNEDG